MLEHFRATHQEVWREVLNLRHIAHNRENAMVEITIRELSRQTGINYQKLLYDVHAQRLPARRVGQRLMVDIDNEVIQSILRDPAAYEAQRDFTSRKKHAILYNNVTYESVAALANAVGVSRETVYSWLREGKVTTVPK